MHIRAAVHACTDEILPIDMIKNIIVFSKSSWCTFNRMIVIGDDEVRVFRIVSMRVSVPFYKNKKKKSKYDWRTKLVTFCRTG